MSVGTTDAGPALAEVPFAFAIVLAPLLIGGVHVGSAVALAGITVASLWLWLVGRGRPAGGVGPLVVVLVVAAGWTAAGAVPIPAGLLARLSPVLADLLDDPLVAGVVVPRLAYSPGAALRGGVELAAAATALLLAAEIARTRGGASRLIAFVVGAGLAVFAVGVVQTAVGAEKLYGVYAPREGATVLGASSLLGFTTSFVNDNHAAELLGLAGVAALGVGGLRDGGPRSRWLVAGVVLLAGVALTGSRAGWLATLVGALFVGGLAGVHRGWLPTYTRWLVPGVAALGMALLLVVGVRGDTRLDIGSHSASGWAEELERKVDVWSDAFAMIEGHPWTGVGRGGFRDALTSQRVSADPSRDAVFAVSYAESVYLDLPAELGLPVGGLVLVAVGLAWLLALARWRGDATAGAALAATLVIAVHGVADFALEFAGVGLPFVVMLAVAVSRRTARPARASWSPWVVVVLGTAALALAPGAISRSSYRAAVGTLLAHTDPLDDATLDEMVRWHPVSADVALARAGYQASQGDPWGSLRWLGRTMLLAPGESRAHELAARTLADVGRRDQALIELRLAFSLDRQHRRWRYGMLHEAEAGLDDVRRVLRDDPELLAGYAQFLLSREPESEIARALASVLSDMQPVPASASRVWARLLEMDGDLDAAVDVLREARGTNPDDPATRMALVSVLSRAGRHDEALAEADDACALDPRNPRAWLAAARVQRAAGESARAKRSLRRVFQLADPFESALRADANIERGKLLRGAGDLLGARDAFREALRLQPDRSRVRVLLGDVFLDLGQLDAALREFERVEAEAGPSPSLTRRKERCSGGPRFGEPGE